MPSPHHVRTQPVRRVLANQQYEADTKIGTDSPIDPAGDACAPSCSLSPSSIARAKGPDRPASTPGALSAHKSGAGGFGVSRPPPRLPVAADGRLLSLSGS
jgi:hypothetical protein